MSVTIIGAGITGLSIGHYLHSKKIEFKILESTAIPGGKVLTDKLNGYRCENGPNTVLYKSGKLKDLINELDLESSIEFASKSVSKNRFIIDKGNIKKLPNSPFSFLFSDLLNIESKFKILRSIFQRDQNYDDKVSVSEYIKKVFGSEVLESIVDPFVTGIFAADPSKISFKHSFPTLFEFSKSQGSIAKGMLHSKKENSYQPQKSSLFTFSNGLSELTFKLAESFKKNIKFNSRVGEIQKIKEEFKVTFLNEGQQKSFTSKIVIDTRPLDLISKKIQLNDSDISFSVPVLTLHLGFEKETTNLNGFGLLTTKNSGSKFLGAIFNSQIFPNSAKPDSDLYTILIGGARNGDLLNGNIDSLINDVILDFRNLLEIKNEPNFIHYHRWDNAIPQYTLRHDELLTKIKKFELDNKGYILAGNYFGGVSIGDRVEQAYIISQKVIKDLSLKKA